LKEITLAHFCQINEQNIVTQVIVVSDDDCDGGQFPDSDPIGAAFCHDLLGGVWKQTSYNSNFRKHYAGIGYKYDSALDMFITPQPYASWTLDAQGDWQPPVAKPEGDYAWDEATQAWVAIEQPA
jgi:hypothetical protein